MLEEKVENGFELMDVVKKPCTEDVGKEGKKPLDAFCEGELCLRAIRSMPAQLCMHRVSNSTPNHF